MNYSIEEFLEQRLVSKAIDNDYIRLKIDIYKMENGEKVANQLRGVQGKDPWIVILDAKGKALISSDSPTGNTGWMMTQQDHKWFIHMLKKTKKRMTQKRSRHARIEIQHIRQELTFSTNPRIHAMLTMLARVWRLVGVLIGARVDRSGAVITENLLLRPEAAGMPLRNQERDNPVYRQL